MQDPDKRQLADSIEEVMVTNRSPEPHQTVPQEIKQLQQAGDALAQGIRTGHWDDALDAWTELRGG